MDTIQKISFIIPNEWGQYLYHILSPIKEKLDGTWDLDDLQAWQNINGKLVNLFDSSCFSNQEFFPLLMSRMYYIVSGKFSLKSSRQNRKGKLNGAYLEVVVTDSVYIDISSVDEEILFVLYTNAIKQGFEHIETDGKNQITNAAFTSNSCKECIIDGTSNRNGKL